MSYGNVFIHELRCVELIVMGEFFDILGIKSFESYPAIFVVCLKKEISISLKSYEISSFKKIYKYMYSGGSGGEL